MDEQKLLEFLSVNNMPVAIGGCKTCDRTFDCCEYDVTIFDGKDSGDQITEFEGNFVQLHHAKLNETKSSTLIQYDNLRILSDDNWELKIFLSQIKEKQSKIFSSHAQSCLIDANFCAIKCKDGLKADDPFASSWQKCAAFYLADALFLINSQRPSPTHMLDCIREFEKNKTNEKFSVVNDCIGIERATASLLSRMRKSTMGFSDMIEANQHSKIIEQKCDYLINHSLLTDCYFYLGYINRNNLIKIKDSLHRKPELIHVLKTAFDIENDPTKVEQQANLLHNTATELLSSFPKN